MLFVLVTYQSELIRDVIKTITYFINLSKRLYAFFMYELQRGTIQSVFQYLFFIHESWQLLSFSLRRRAIHKRLI